MPHFGMGVPKMLFFGMWWPERSFFGIGVCQNAIFCMSGKMQF